MHSLPAQRVVRRILGSFQQFFSTAAAGGVILIVSAAIALGWANSAWAESYHHLWELPLVASIGTFRLSLTLHEFVNDGLMAIFFCLVGLEIKREVLVGELSSGRSAALPVAAALGGMLLPAMLYALFNAGDEGARGWGIPMATDIAFALGVLALLGDRVPLSLRVFLAALAIADDLGAVLVIALFYSHEINVAALGGVGAIVILLLAINRFGVRNPVAYSLLGVVLWGFMLASGIHASIAGVLLALTVPARMMISENEFIDNATESLRAFREADSPPARVLSSREHLEALHDLENSVRLVQSPLQRMEHSLHAPVAFLIMPLFALANAGVPISGEHLQTALEGSVALGVMLGLLVGKPLGITLACYAATRAGIAELPSTITWRQLHGAAWLGGIGFTMSLFIAALAFPVAAQLEEAKLGVLAASTLAGIVGYLILRKAPQPHAADS